MNCIGCHRVAGVELPRPRGTRHLDLELAGDTRFVRSYRDLVTAVTNPQHVVNEQYRELFARAGTSKGTRAVMPDYRDDMSVRQLMDVLAFLDRAYARSKVEFESSEP